MLLEMSSTLIFLLSLGTTHAQVKLPVLPDSLFSAYYQQRLSLFKTLPVLPGCIIFLGNSITNGSTWSALFPDTKLINMGISGDNTAGVIHRLPIVLHKKPAKVFLLIGTNDLAARISPDSVIKNIFLIADYIHQEAPATQLYVQSILPVNDAMKSDFPDHLHNTKVIQLVNEQLEMQADRHFYTYLNLFSFFAGADNKLRPDFTNDGLHLMGKAYMLWKHLLFPAIYDVSPKPALLPLPRELNWVPGNFPLYQCSTIVVQDTSFYQEASRLQHFLNEAGWDYQIKTNCSPGEPYIELSKNQVAAPENENEAYTLQVTANKIVLTAATTHGIFNGLQTLRQLMRGGGWVEGCHIRDWPAFAWRGYMIDVGRNYMSVPLLKQQIDVMASMKLNVFHFHATEDIAWRFAIQQYPQLTAPENMLRNKGMYYSDAEISDLIAYCKSHYITFVPELDMPGHSAAFSRALHTSMQSDSGLAYIKNILKEVCTKFSLPYIHIGADEVKITNQNFIPEVTNYLEGFGKKVIGWQPGGNFTRHTIRQWWMDDTAHQAGDNQYQYIDSRHLYLNHMDPEEAVVTIFNRMLCNKIKGDSLALGATLCMWPDRAVAQEEDVLQMNPVYPGMLAFAERCWRGGGQAGWIANINEGDTSAFFDFEKRLLDIKKIFFRKKAFPYIKQANMEWTLTGPFNNGGHVNEVFLPEKNFDTLGRYYFYKRVTGATIVLRHWWYPLIEGAVTQPEENTTFYASKKIWCAEAGIKKFWIGFNDISRSTATDSPPANAWDDKGSQVWVNGQLIAPPKWKHAGQKGNPEIPLLDEGYSYRPATEIYLNKGWNTVLLKLPVTSFRGKDWQNPVKWMFTFVELPE